MALMKTRPAPSGGRRSSLFLFCHDDEKFGNFYQYFLCFCSITVKAPQIVHNCRQVITLTLSSIGLSLKFFFYDPTTDMQKKWHFVFFDVTAAF